MRLRKIILICGMWLFLSACSKQIPHQATGIKIGEVTDTSAIIWTRLTVNPERVGSDAPLPTVTYVHAETGEAIKPKGRDPKTVPTVHFPKGFDVSTIEGACPGIAGDVRIQYKGSDDIEWQKTEWLPVDPDADFTRQIKLENLKPATKYDIQVESKADDFGQVIKGLFRTAPAPDQSAKVTFMVTTGTAYVDMDLPDEGYKMYRAMGRMNPSFFVHTGDILYYDSLAKNRDLALWHWQRMYSLPTNVEFHKQVPSCFIKDDHDTWVDDCWPTKESKFMGEFTFAEGLEIFPQQVPMGEKTYRTYRWGKHLQVWLMEGRDFRSDNPMPDGPEKTIWGAEQKAWFKKTVQESDATFKVVISPTPIVGPDRTKKNDNHSNAGFQTEGDEIRKFISQQKNMISVCGDRHWQYVSVDQKYGVKEYSCGPASNEHAGGWSNDMLRPEHRYLNVTGGFLAVTVDPNDGNPILSGVHYDVDGNELHLDQIEAK